MNVKVFALICLFLLGAAVSLAQSVFLDSGFDSSVVDELLKRDSSQAGRVEAVSAQADGKILIAGRFKGGGLVRLNKDGGIDDSFSVGRGSATIMILSLIRGLGLCMGFTRFRMVK